LSYYVKNGSSLLTYMRKGELVKYPQDTPAILFAEKNVPPIV
jgi:hypothetical protein